MNPWCAARGELEAERRWCGRAKGGTVVKVVCLRWWDTVVYGRGKQPCVATQGGAVREKLGKKTSGVWLQV